MISRIFYVGRFWYDIYDYANDSSMAYVDSLNSDKWYMGLSGAQKFLYFGGCPVDSLSVKTPPIKTRKTAFLIGIALVLCSDLHIRYSGRSCPFSTRCYFIGMYEVMASCIWRF